MSRFRFTIRGLCAALAATLLGGACGAGEGTERLLPAGPPTSAPPGDMVMYVSEGQGNRVAAYRLGTDGLVPSTPFSTLEVANPRRLLLADGILYIAFPDGVASASLGTDGRLPANVTATTDLITGANAIDIVIVGDVLYVSFEQLRTINAYRLQSGQVTPDPISISGTNSSNYGAIATRGRFLYGAANGSQRIDTYLINANGTLDPDPIPQTPQTVVGLPQDLLIVGESMYVSDGNRQRIQQFEILETGLLPEDPLTETRSTEFYARLLMQDSTIYASAFNGGQIDLYPVDPSTGEFLTERPISSTFEDVASNPNGMVIDNGILYVAQSGRDRVDAYILAADGIPPDFPSSSTAVVMGSFPNDVLVGMFPP